MDIIENETDITEMDSDNLLFDLSLHDLNLRETL